MLRGKKKPAASSKNEIKNLTQSSTSMAYKVAEPLAWLQQLLMAQQT